METQFFEENKTEVKNQLLFAIITTAAFLILMYGSVFKGIPMGINVEIFILVCYISMFCFFKKFRGVARKTVFQTLAVLLLGITFALYNNLILLTINAFLIIMIVGAQYRRMLKNEKGNLHLFESIKDGCVVWFGYTFGGIKGAFQSLGKNKRVSGIKGIVIGIAITVPVLAAVIALLMSADLVFSDILAGAFKNINAQDIVGYSIAGIALFVCASGLYYSLGTRRPKAIPVQEKLIRFNRTAALLLVACIDVVLAFFAAIQFAYLFAGNVPAGYTYAQYAQNGFWQLVLVAVIVIVIMFILKKSAEVSGRSVKILLSLLCALTEILLVSAFWRMVLYEQAYSFSILRIFTQAFMVATAGVFITLIISLWKQAFHLKKWVFVVGMVCYLALNFMNADAFIAQQNAAIGGDKVDVKYLSQLSVDALPYYADKIDAKLKEKKESGIDGIDYEYFRFSRGLVNMKDGIEKAEGWQYFNVSRENAKAYITQYKQNFDIAQSYVNDVVAKYKD